MEGGELFDRIVDDGEFSEAGEWIPGRAGGVKSVREGVGRQGVDCRFGHRPATVTVEAHRDDLVSCGVRGGEHVAGRYARHIVFSTSAPEQDYETTSTGHPGIVGSRPVGYRAP